MPCLNENCGKMTRLKATYEPELRRARFILKMNLFQNIMMAWVIVVAYRKPDLNIVMTIMVGAIIIVNLIYLIFTIKLSKPIRKDKNAFEKLIKMRERKIKFLSKEEYIKTIKECDEHQPE